VKLTRTGVELLINGKHTRQIEYATIKVLAVGAIREPGTKPVLVIDLVFDTLYDVLEHHRVLRMTSTGFNPMKLIPDQTNAGAAFKRLIQILLMKSGAEGLPDASSVSGNPYANYNSIKAYEQTIYFE